MTVCLNVPTHPGSCCTDVLMSCLAVGLKVGAQKIYCYLMRLLSNSIWCFTVNGEDIKEREGERRERWVGLNKGDKLDSGVLYEHVVISFT